MHEKSFSYFEIREIAKLFRIEVECAIKYILMEI